MHLIPLKRKISKIEIDKKEALKLFPKKIIKVLEILSKERNVIIKGGFAKSVLGQILKNEGKIKKNMALENEWDVLTDIDLILTFTGTKNKSMPGLIEKVEQLIEKLKTIGFELNSHDIELIKGSTKDEKMIKRILESRDMTINEIILMPEEDGGQWLLYHTSKTIRDTIDAIGLITVNSVNVRYYDYGRMRASYYGTTRLIRSLAEGKVKHIYLPDWWVERTKEKAKEENRPSLGLYGTILAERYVGHPKVQKRFMNILNDLNLTELKDFQDYRKKQADWFYSYTGNRFSLDQKTSFQQIQQKSSEKKERYAGLKKQRKINQASCSHFVESFVCTYCPEECKIKHCEKCNKLEVVPKKLSKPIGLNEVPCNKAFIESEFYWGKKVFYPKIATE